MAIMAMAVIIVTIAGAVVTVAETAGRVAAVVEIVEAVAPAETEGPAGAVVVADSCRR